MCDHRDGSKICHLNWFGPNCSTECTPKNDSKGHYDCEAQDGTKICHRDWYGPNCSVKCIPRDDFAGHYTCDTSDGSRLCYKYWYGPNCTVFCRPQDSYQGHYTCHAETGEKVCLKGWEGEGCVHRVSTRPPETTSSPSTVLYTDSESTVDSNTTDPLTEGGILPIEKQSKSPAQEKWLTKTRIGLITGGFALLLCLCAIGLIALLSCRSRAKPVPYSRQHNEKGTEKGSSLDRSSKGMVNPAADILSQYEMNDMFFKVQEVSWGEDGSRQVDDHLVMYNNPLFNKRKQIKGSGSTNQLTLDSEWNVVFDL